MKCPKCDAHTRVLYRNRQKGEYCDFVCMNCLPAELVPSDEDQDATLDIQRALRWKRRGKITEESEHE